MTGAHTCSRIEPGFFPYRINTLKVSYMIKNNQRNTNPSSMDKYEIINQSVDDYLQIKYINEDKVAYGYKSTNLLRISQEKKIKKLQLAMLRWADKFSNTTEYDKSNWRKNFTSVLRMEKHLSSGLNNTLSREELKLANKLYRKYLGFVK